MTIDIPLMDLFDVSSGPSNMVHHFQADIDAIGRIWRGHGWAKASN